MELYDILKMITDAEQAAGETIRQAHGIIATRKSSARDVVTEYDKAVQSRLMAAIRAKLPDAHFFCEELEEEDSLDAEHVFVIDPIDGTANFVHGLRQSCTSVAYLGGGELKAAAIYNPYADEMFSAVKGGGCFLNGERVSAETGSLGEVISFFGTSPYYPECTDRTFAIARLLFDRSLDIRRGGSAALDLCSVAAGRAGFFYEARLSFWDYAAGALLVKEAGGTVLTEDGKELPLDGRKSSVIAGSPRAVEDFLKFTNR